MATEGIGDIWAPHGSQSQALWGDGDEELHSTRKTWKMMGMEGQGRFEGEHRDEDEDREWEWAQEMGRGTGNGNGHGKWG